MFSTDTFLPYEGRTDTDNRTNFKGADNAFGLDCEQVAQETSTQRIVWRFNPSSAPWWGGFFKRLIGVVKQLLRCALGRASLVAYEDLLMLVCDCEAAVNSRPLTYVSNDSDDLVALTPAMFLRDLANTSMPDCDEVGKTSLLRIVRNRQKLRDDMRKRFRLK